MTFWGWLLYISATLMQKEFLKAVVLVKGLKSGLLLWNQEFGCGCGRGVKGLGGRMDDHLLFGS